MATANEKQARQDARDAARQSIVVGQQRKRELGQAQSAFPQRRLRAAGDLSRYAIGGFLDDPTAPMAPTTGGGPSSPGGGRKGPSRQRTAPPPAPTAPVAPQTPARGTYEQYGQAHGDIGYRPIVPTNLPPIQPAAPEAPNYPYEQYGQQTGDIGYRPAPTATPPPYEQYGQPTGNIGYRPAQTEERAITPEQVGQVAGAVAKAMLQAINTQQVVTGMTASQQAAPSFLGSIGKSSLGPVQPTARPQAVQTGKTTGDIGYRTVPAKPAPKPSSQTTRKPVSRKPVVAAKPAAKPAAKRATVATTAKKMV